MKITCFGDSLTYGNVGYSYIPFLDKKFQTINKGKNGETIRGGQERLEEIISNPDDDSETYILGLGTNDILLPYLRTVSVFWFIMMSIRCKIKKCIKDEETFYKEYDKLLNQLSSRNKKVIVFGMPFINLKNFPERDLINKNRIIEELAKKHNYPFIDIYKLQKEKIENDFKEYTWKYGFLMRVIDGTIMTLLPSSKDTFAKLRGLTTTVDGAHFNSESAKILAMEIEKYLV